MLRCHREAGPATGCMHGGCDEGVWQAHAQRAGACTCARLHAMAVQALDGHEAAAPQAPPVHAPEAAIAYDVAARPAACGMLQLAVGEVLAARRQRC